jgi:hypothetical protein
VCRYKPQYLADAEDPHTLVLDEREQPPISGNYEISPRGKRRADDGIVIRVREDTLNRHRPYEDCRIRVAIHELINRGQMRISLATPLQYRSMVPG